MTTLDAAVTPNALDLGLIVDGELVAKARAW